MVSPVTEEYRSQEQGELNNNKHFGERYKNYILSSPRTLNHFNITKPFNIAI